MSAAVIPAWSPKRLRLSRFMVLALPATACLLGVLLLVAPAPATAGGHPVHATSGLPSAGAGMALAMMAPLSVPLLRAVHQASLWWLAPRTLISALTGYLGVWVIAGIGLHAPVHLLLHGGWLTSGLEVLVPGVVLGAACAARLWSRAHWRAVAACGGSHPVRRRRAVPDAARWGVNHAFRCVRVCTLPMLLGALGHGWLSLAVLTGLLAAERLLAAPPRRAIAAGYLVLGVLAGLGGTL